MRLALLVDTPEQVAVPLGAGWASKGGATFPCLQRDHAQHARARRGRARVGRRQVPGGLIYVNAPGWKQTKKRRSIVPIAPSLAAWLEDASGHHSVAAPRRRRGRGETVFDRAPAGRIKTAFEKRLVAAGLVEHALDDGESACCCPLNS